jgi:hypothetical protein
VLSVVDYFRAIATHANSKLNEFMIVLVLRLFLTFQPHLTMKFYLSSPLLLVPTVILVRYKEWTRNMMAMCGTRLRQLTSITIST